MRHHPVLILDVDLCVDDRILNLDFDLLSQDAEIDVGTVTVIPAGGEPYAGPYEFTPTRETQTVHTAEKYLSDDITLNPIPSNYGLITYNGVGIRVS